MSKKQVIKNIKKNSKDNINIEQKDNFFKFVTTLMIMLLVVILVYFLIGVFYTKEINFKSDNKDDKEQEINIDNSIITLGQIFDQNKDEYYVIIYDMSDDKSIISPWISIFENNNKSLFKVDSSKKFNQKYLTKENSNKNASSYSDLKVISPTLIKINNKVITEYIEGEDSIKEYLKNN